MKFYIRVLFLFVTCVFTFSVWAGITVGATRLIYNETENEASISVSNHIGSAPYLIQSWIEQDGDSSAKVPFIVTPPLFRLDGGHENTLRIIYVGEKLLPGYRETVFWLNVKSIPSMERSDQNRLLITVKTRIKLFYRPAILNKEKANEAWRGLIFKRAGNQVVISNPTPFYISLFSLKVGSHSVERPPMVPPYGTVKFIEDGQIVVWRAIDDFGGVTEEASQALH